MDYPIELRDLKGKFLEIKTHLRNGHTITFRDSCSLTPGSLEKIVKDMDATRKLDDVDILNVSWNDILHSKKMHDYRIDCKSLYEILETYQETSTTKFGTNPLHHVSASSFAKKIFYSKYYNTDKYPLYVLPRAMSDFIAGAYGGGRNEIFCRGHFTKTPIFPYDFTSFYPSVGREKLPYGIPLWKDGLDNHLHVPPRPGMNAKKAKQLPSQPRGWRRSKSWHWPTSSLSVGTGLYSMTVNWPDLTWTTASQNLKIEFKNA